MGRLLFISMILLTTLSNIQIINAQPISLEIMGGNNYGKFTMVMNKKFSENSKFGFFHLDIIEFDYINNMDHDLMLQNLLYYEPLKNFRLTGGAFYGGKPGFKPTLGTQYSFNTKNFFLLIAPRINIEENPTYDIFSLLKAELPINNNLSIFSSIQSLNLLNKDGIIKCGQELRLGVDTKGYKFGLAAGFEQRGSRFEKSGNFGVFIQKEIF
ncbi:MAG: hypothetical protein WCE64_00005 [Bacteroidales bacterium]